MTIYGVGTATIEEYGYLSKAKLDTEFAHWHDQMLAWVSGFITLEMGTSG